MKKEEKSFKKIITVVATIISSIVVLFIFVSPSSIDAGYEGVLVKKPWFFGHGGVEPIPVKTGLIWRVRSTQVFRVNIKPYNINEVFDDLITIDNNPVDFIIHLTFKNIEGKTPILVEKFGSDWYANKVREPLRNMARTFTKSHKMFEMTADAATTAQMQNIITTELKFFLHKENIPIELLKVTIGKVLAPAEVISATVATAVQKQNVKTQQERVKAEEARAKAETASANADKAYALTFGFSPKEYLEIKKLENQRLAIDGATNGKINMTLIMGNAQPMVNVGK